MLAAHPEPMPRLPEAARPDGVDDLTSLHRAHVLRAADVTVEEAVVDEIRVEAVVAPELVAILTPQHEGGIYPDKERSRH